MLLSKMVYLSLFIIGILIFGCNQEEEYQKNLKIIQQKNLQEKTQLELLQVQKKLKEEALNEIQENLKKNCANISEAFDVCRMQHEKLGSVCYVTYKYRLVDYFRLIECSPKVVHYLNSQHEVNQ